jgi:hypothetical protein
MRPTVDGQQSAVLVVAISVETLVVSLPQQFERNAPWLQTYVGG